MKSIIIVAAVALILTIVLVYRGVSASNKEAKEKGTSEKPYTVWSVISGFVIGFFVILYELVMEVFIGRRNKY